MNYNNSKSTSESTKNNSQNSTFNANVTASIVTWSKEELEILQLYYEEKIASMVSYDSVQSHNPSCNCVECN